MNSVIDLLQSHRSIRKFTDQPVSDEIFETLVKSGQGAATSSFLQGTTIIRVKQPEVRNDFVEITGGQSYVATAPEFMVFCADLRRSSNCCAMHDAVATEGFTEQFIIATVDVALMAQNMVVAAESIGLGICYIGGIRNDPAWVARLLDLPQGVYPVFGLCLGYPDQDPEVKPRLPVEVIVKTDRYLETGDKEQIQHYDETVQNYYQTRTGGNKSMGWSEQMSDFLGKESRPHMRGFLKGQGFEMK
ncbi:MAG: nitroreductase [Gammaproteobacteria bacterium]|jgi:nitroreductase